MTSEATSTCSRVARQQGWPNEIWSIQLAGQLSGDALDAFSSVPAEAAWSYAQVKEVILAQFEVNAETYRLRFCSTWCKMGESYKILLSRQSDQLNRWTHYSGSRGGFRGGSGGSDEPPSAPKTTHCMCLSGLVKQ